MSGEPTPERRTHEPEGNQPTGPKEGDTQMTEPTGSNGQAPVPTADPALAALAVLSRFGAADFDTVNALLDTTDSRELVMGLLDVSRYLASMVARAADTTEHAVIEHLRSIILGLVNNGAMTTGPFPLP